MARRSGFVNFLEYIPLRLAVSAVDAVPLGASLSLSRAVGDLAWLILPRRRRTAVSNVLKAGITDDVHQAGKIALESFRSFSSVTVEALAASRIITPETIKDHVEFNVPQATWDFLAEPGRGGIYVSAHLGNWELSGHIMSFYKKLCAVARTLDNPYAQKLMLRRNPRRNMEIISKHSADRGALLRPLKSGQMLGLISDQHATSHRILTDFLGTPAWTVTSPARLHLATKCPIVCGVCIRQGHMRFRVFTSEPLTFAPSGDRDADIARITADMNRRLGDYIRQFPEQYLWAHKRWR